MEAGVMGSKDLVKIRSFSLKILCVKWKVINNFIFSQSYQMSKNSFMTGFYKVIHNKNFIDAELFLMRVNDLIL